MPEFNDLIDSSTQLYIWIIIVIVIIVIVIIGSFLDSTFVAMRGESNTRCGAFVNFLLQLIFIGIISYLGIQLFRYCLPNNAGKIFLIPLILGISILTQFNMFKNIYKMVQASPKWFRSGTV